MTHHQYSHVNFPYTRVSRIAGRLTLLFFILFVGSSSFGQKKYIAKYKPLADSLSKEYGIPTSIILGVAILESASGTSKNCKLLNNHFGVVGKNNLLKSKGIKTRYKQYPDAHASYVHFCKVVAKKKYYKKLKNNKDYKLWADEMSKAGYSEVPEEWKTKVINTIEKNKLSASP